MAPNNVFHPTIRYEKSTDSITINGKEVLREFSQPKKCPKFNEAKQQGNEKKVGKRTSKNGKYFPEDTQTTSQIRENDLSRRDNNNNNFDLDTHDIKELKRSRLISDETFRNIGVNLPLKTFGKRLDLVYSSFEHGFSLQNLYRKSKSWSLMYEVFDEQTPCVLVVCDSNGHVFGAVCSSLPSIRGRHFTGNGESMLFTLIPNFQIFPWSMENDFFMHCGKDYIGIGGSKNDCGKEAKVGLWLDDGLLHGRSTKCQTYKNEILASDEDFEICGVELWTFTA